MHGGGDLIGFDLLAVHTGAGLLGNGRQFFSGAGDLGHAVADAADQVAQGDAHARDALLQHTEFVAAGDVLGQVAAGDALDHGQGFSQWAGDLTGDDDRSNHADQQGQQGADQLEGTRLSAFDVATIKLNLIQLLAQGHDGGALIGHFLTRLHGFAVGVFIGHQRAAIMGQRRFQLTQGIWLSISEMHVQLFEAGDRHVDLADGFLLGFGVGGGGVAAHFVTGEDERFLGGTDGLELRETLLAHVHLLNALADRLDLVVRALGVDAHGVARGVAGAIGVTHFVQGCLVFGDGRRLLLEQFDVFRALEAADELLLLRGEAVEGGLYILRSGFVAVGQHVLQAHHAQFGQAGVELGDVAHPVTAVNQAAQAGPAGQGQNAGQCQDKAEAQAQFHVHADVAEPAIHHNILQKLVFLDRR